MTELSKRFKNIALADDDADDRELFAEAVNLIDPSIGITLKRDGEELMLHLNATTSAFDLIFLDLNMPKKNGKECLDDIRKNKGHAHTPVIIYTTSLNPVDIEDAFSLGATFFLRKPNSFEELKDLLGRVLSDIPWKIERSRERFVINKALLKPFNT